MYIVIETYGIPTIVANEAGYPILFRTKEEAQAEAENCQKGIVVLI